MCPNKRLSRLYLLYQCMSNHTPPVGYTPAYSRLAISIRHYLWCGVIIQVLTDVCSLYQCQPDICKVLPFIPLYAWKREISIELMLVTLLVRTRKFLRLYDPFTHLFSWYMSSNSASVVFPYHDPLLPTPKNCHIALTEVVADTPVRRTCFSEV